MSKINNILVVEDDALIRDLYTTFLASTQLGVESAGSAEELYKKLESFKPDCILLDIMLPESSGLQILKELRSDPKHGCIHIKIVILTNLAQQSVTDVALENGADGFIIKADILPNDLIAIIHSLEE